MSRPVIIPYSIEEGFLQKERQRSSLLFGGHHLFYFLPHQEDLKISMNLSFYSYHPGSY